MSITNIIIIYYYYFCRMPKPLNNNCLQKILPYVYPFLLIDYIEDYTAGKTITAVKNITANEWPFKGADCRFSHYPETLLIEAAAQAALALYHLTFCDDTERSSPIIGRVYSEFPGTVCVGDQVKFNIVAGRFMRRGGYATIDASSRNGKCAEIKIVYGIRPWTGLIW